MLICGAFTAFPITKYFVMPGMYSWILLFCVMVLLKKRRHFALLIFIPEIVNILVCAASPLANSLRYELPVVAAAPFLIFWTWLCLGKDFAKTPKHDK